MYNKKEKYEDKRGATASDTEKSSELDKKLFRSSIINFVIQYPVDYCEERKDIDAFCHFQFIIVKAEKEEIGHRIGCEFVACSLEN